MHNQNPIYAIEDVFLLTNILKKLPFKMQKTNDMIIDLYEFKEKNMGK
jgi:hypothetical protein